MENLLMSHDGQINVSKRHHERAKMNASVAAAAWIKVPPAALSPPFTSALYRFEGARWKYISPGSFFMGARRRKPRGGVVGGGPEAAFHLWLDTFFGAQSILRLAVLLWRLSRLLLLLHKSFSVFSYSAAVDKGKYTHAVHANCGAAAGCRFV